MWNAIARFFVKVAKWCATHPDVIVQAVGTVQAATKKNDGPAQ